MKRTSKMATIAKGVLALLLLIFSCNTDAFISRSPLYMTKGDIQNTSSRETNEAPSKATTFHSVSTSRETTRINNRNNDNNNSNNIGRIAQAPKTKNVYRQKGRPTKAAAPLVDSTLLRFLSAQKNQLEQKSKEDFFNDNIDTRSIMTDTSGTAELESVDDLVGEIDLIQSIADNGIHVDDDLQIESSKDKCTTNIVEESGGEKPDSSQSSTLKELEDTTAESISWFTQYNAHNVAKKLIALGASSTSANEAGNSVQNYSLSRTTRQRVRKFLRDRDLIWATSTKMPSSSTDLSDVISNASGSKYEISSLQYETSFRGERNNIDNTIQVLIDAGLTGNDIAAIFTHTPSITMMHAMRQDGIQIMGETLEDTLQRAYHGVLCSTVKLRKYDARKVLRTCPGLLTKRGSTSSEEVINILCSLDVSPTSLCRDKAALPILLSRSPASVFRLVAFLTSDAVRMPVKSIGTLIKQSKCAGLLDIVAPLPGKSSYDTMSLESLINDRSSNIVENEVSRRYKEMFKTAKFLRREIGVKNLGLAISSCPTILALDIESQIIPCVEFLSQELELDEEDIPRVLELYPAILSTDFASMQINMDYLMSLEVSKDDLSCIFGAFPSLLTQDISNMKKVVNFLSDIGVSNIGRFVTRLPAVLGYSVENDLIPKWLYLKTVRQYASFDVSRFPAYFSYPLDRVTMSRYEYLYQVKQIPLQLLSLDEVLRYGDNEFASNIALDDDGGISYAAFIKQRKERRKQQHNSGKSKKSLDCEI